MFGHAFISIGTFCTLLRLAEQRTSGAEHPRASVVDPFATSASYSRVLHAPHPAAEQSTPAPAS